MDMHYAICKMPLCTSVKLEIEIFSVDFRIHINT